MFSTRGMLNGSRGLRWLGGLVAAVVALSWAIPAGATTANPYSGSGYDVSFPNCNESTPGGFGIVGLGGGRPFTTNSCLTEEWKQAAASSSVLPGLYFNTGYAGAYGRDVTSSCATYAGPSLAGVSKHEQGTYAKAWEIGCSEAAYAATTAGNNGEVPSMWWADIETGNSWSTNKTLNQYTVDGISYGMMQSAQGLGGVYSYAAAWDQIVGSGFTPTPAFAGVWGPNLSCTSPPGFTGSTQSPEPVWVVQGGTTGGVDTDTGCG